VPDLPSGTYAVALEARDEAALLQLGRTLTAANIQHVAVTESDAPYAGQLMAIGCAPAPKEHLRRYLSSLRLIRGPR
jgi:hypothetical protein